MNIDLEDGRHPIADNAWVEVLDNRPVEVGFVPIEDCAEPLFPSPIPRQFVSLPNLTRCVEAYLPAWIEPLVGAGPVVLESVQPTHVLFLWWESGETLEGHPTHSHTASPVVVRCDVGFNRDGVEMCRDGASTLTPDGGRFQLTEILHQT